MSTTEKETCYRQREKSYGGVASGYPRERRGLHRDMGPPGGQPSIEEGWYGGGLELAEFDAGGDALYYGVFAVGGGAIVYFEVYTEQAPECLPESGAE